MSIKGTRLNKELVVKDKLNIRIHPIGSIDAQEWDQFLNSTSESTFFCTTDWWNTFEDAYILQIRDNNGKLVGGVPFRTLKVLPIIGKYFRFSWLDSSVLVSDGLNQEDHLNIKKISFEYLVKHLEKTGVIVMTISSKSHSLDENLFQVLFKSSEKCATLIVDLSKEEEDILKSFEKRKKNSIRKAKKMGVVINILEGESGLPLIPDYCLLQNKMFEYKSNSYSDIYAKSAQHIKSILLSKQKTFIAMAYYQGQPVVGNIMVSHKKAIYAYLGASDNMLNRATNASTLLELESMMYVKRKGYDSYDLGGIPAQVPDSTDSLYGIYLYKKGFGGAHFVFDCATYMLRKSRYRFIWRLRKLDTNPVMRKIYKLLKKFQEKNK